MNFAIYSSVLKEKDIPAIQDLFNQLDRLGANIFIHDAYLKQLEACESTFNIKRLVTVFHAYEDFKKLDVDFFLSLGGDGTILRSIIIVKDTNVPVLGINLGRLGFLANTETDRIKDALNSLYTNAFRLEKRRLLQLESDPHLFGDSPFALNDCTLLKRDTSSMVIVHTYINGEFLNSYWADGIIISTPTGSTGYSLSCGGPIVFPDSGNFVITPVAPHNLNVRPIVISDDSIISFEIEGRSENFLCTLDARYVQITATHQLAVRKADFAVNLVRVMDQNFLSTIREKLAWGVDKRNNY